MALGMAVWVRLYTVLGVCGAIVPVWAAVVKAPTLSGGPGSFCQAAPDVSAEGMAGTTP